MRSTLKFLLALVVAFAAMLTFRALVFTIYTVPDASVEPTFKAGDRVMVNRWSYGLRTNGSDQNTEQDGTNEQLAFHSVSPFTSKILHELKISYSQA